MKKCIILLFLLCFVFPQSSAADSPIYSGGYWESAPSVAYNSEDGEFFVVWNVYNTDYPFFDPKFYGPVMGQLIKENGSPIEEPFQIFSSGVFPKVAYNATTKEYLVVAEQWLNTVGQRVSRLGKVIGGQTTLLTSARWPRVLYNSQSGKYLVTGARLAESPSGSGQCRIWIYTVQVGGDGRPEGPVSTPVYQNYSLGNCLEGAVYAIAYGPVTSVSYPNGKYLLAVKDARDLIILGSDGTYSTAAGSYNDGSQIKDPFNVDATFGYLDGNPVFFLVWGDGFSL